MNKRVLSLLLMTTGAAISSGAAEPDSTTAPKAVEQPSVRSDVLYLPDTAEGHHNGERLQEFYHFQQEIIYRDLDKTHIKLLVPETQVAPEYPSQLANRKIPGSVTLVFIVNELGFVTEAAVSKSSNADFDAPALKMIKKWKFRPSAYDGVPIRNLMVLPVNFSPK